jgi:hypothetical protein
MINKPRIGRPRNEAGHVYCTIGVSGTPAEIAAVMELTPRKRLEAMLATIHNETPPGHRHDGGHWIACPFCADDLGRQCGACNGTQRIWEMPAE